jgi:hypothetical protein
MTKYIKFLAGLLIAIPLTLSAQVTNVNQGGTGATTTAQGDLFVGGTNNIRLQKLPIGTAGQILLGSSTSPFKMAWVATSSLGITGGSGNGLITSILGFNGFTARWTGTSSLSIGNFLDNGTVTGVGATSSITNLFVKGTPTLTNIVDFASSSLTSFFKVAGSGVVTAPTVVMTNATTSTLTATGQGLFGDVGGVYNSSAGSGVGGIGFNSIPDGSYLAGVAGYGALFQLAPSTGAFTAYLESNVSAGSAHGHTITLSWDNAGVVTIPKGVITNGTSTSFFATNFFATNASTTNFFATNAVHTNSTSTNFGATNGNITNATSTTGWFSSLLSALNVLFTSGTTTNWSATNLNGTASVYTNATTTSFGSTNATITNATTTSINTTNFNATNSTTTNFRATNESIVNGTATSFSATNLNGTSLVYTNGTTTSFGSTNATITNATTTSINTTNFNASNSTSTTYGGTNITVTSATTTNLSVTNVSLVGVTNSCLATNGANVIVASTTACSGGASLSGGSNGLVARWTSASTLSTGLLQDNGSNAGVNATTSTSTFLIKGNTGTSKILTVASSSVGEVFTVDSTGYIGISTSTPAYQLTVATGSIFCGENLPNATSTAMTISVTNGCSTVIRYGVANIVLTFSNVTAGMKWDVSTCAPPSGTPGTIFFSTSTNQIYWGGSVLPASTATVNKCDDWYFKATQGTSSSVTVPSIHGSISPSF